MRILIVGSGAREHAFAWRLAQERSVRELVCAPGNPGIASRARVVPQEPTDPGRLLDLVRRERIDFTIVGPEQPLAAGLVDRLAEGGHLVLGPTRAAARLETSKAFAKAFMARHGVPTARARICHKPVEANGAVAELGLPVAIKADGLAAGKGVTIAQDADSARIAIAAAMITGQFGDAGRTLVVEEALEGPEVSFFVLSDGERAWPILSAQDHKRVFDDDRGPNTGGMGAFAPSPLVTPDLARLFMDRIVQPTLRGMLGEGTPFRGFLYCGLMLTRDGPKVIEYNVRFGDPEAQVVLPLLRGELAETLASAAAGTLGTGGLEASPGVEVGVVVASAGYPGRFDVGRPIYGLDRVPDDVQVFHAGTKKEDGHLVTAGGRVLTVVAGGATFEDAIDRAYAGVSQVSFEGMHYRRDIGRKALRF